MNPNRFIWGAVLFIGIAGLALGLILAASGVSARRGFRYDVVFGDGKNLRVGDPVILSGTEIGKVEAMKLEPGGSDVRATLKILPENRARIMADSTAFIADSKTAGASGGKVVEIYNAVRPSEPIAPRQSVRGKDTFIELKSWQLRQQVEQWGEEVARTTRSLTENAKELAGKAREAAALTAEEIRKGIEQGKAASSEGGPPVNPTPPDEKTKMDVQETSKKLTEFLMQLGQKGKKNMAELSERWQKLKSELGPQMKDMAESGMEKTQKGLENITSEIERQLSEMQRAWEQRKKESKDAPEQEPIAEIDAPVKI